MDKFVLNLIHRPEMVPEYSATVTGQGKEEDIGDKALLTESLDIFKIGIKKISPFPRIFSSRLKDRKFIYVSMRLPLTTSSTSFFQKISHFYNTITNYFTKQFYNTYIQQFFFVCKHCLFDYQ